MRHWRRPVAGSLLLPELIAPSSRSCPDRPREPPARSQQTLHPGPPKQDIAHGVSYLNDCARTSNGRHRTDAMHQFRAVPSIAAELAASGSHLKARVCQVCVHAGGVAVQVSDHGLEVRLTQILPRLRGSARPRVRIDAGSGRRPSRKRSKDPDRWWDLCPYPQPTVSCTCGFIARRAMNSGPNRPPKPPPPPPPD